MKRLVLVVVLFIASRAADAQTPTPLLVRGCQPYFQNVKEVAVYNSRKAAPPVTEPTPPLPNQWRSIVIPISLTRTPPPTPNGTPVCGGGDPNTTYFQVDATNLDGPGVWNTWTAFAHSYDDPTLVSDPSNVVTPAGSKAFAPALLP